MVLPHPAPRQHGYTWKEREHDHKLSEAFPVNSLGPVVDRTRFPFVETRRAAWPCVTWEHRAWAAATGSTPGTQPQTGLTAARLAYDLRNGAPEGAPHQSSLQRRHPYAPTKAASIAGTISNAECSSALSLTIAPTEQYFSSDSRMASSTAWAETSTPVTM